MWDNSNCTKNKSPSQISIKASSQMSKGSNQATLGEVLANRKNMPRREINTKCQSDQVSRIVGSWSVQKGEFW
jgi:hypothetical protein